MVVQASVQIFGGRKSFTALKSCYHRNVETFKQIFAFEVFLTRARSEGTVPDEMSALATHSDPSIARQAYLEQRLEDARTAGVPVGNLNVKVIDHWHQNGWYGMFKTRSECIFKVDTTREVAHSTIVFLDSEKIHVRVFLCRFTGRPVCPSLMDHRRHRRITDRQRSIRN